jgi:hypothetical protein
MGNQLTQPRLDAAEAVAELGGSVTFKDSLGAATRHRHPALPL